MNFKGNKGSISVAIHDGIFLSQFHPQHGQLSGKGA